MNTRPLFFLRVVVQVWCRANYHQDAFLKTFDNDWSAFKEAGKRAVQRELERSLEPLVPKLTNSSDVEDMVAMLVNEPEYAVLILNNRLFVARTFLENDRVKYKKHVTFARSALTRAPVSDMVYQYQADATGSSNRFECDSSKLAGFHMHDGGKNNKYFNAAYKKRFGTIMPRLSIAKREGYEVCGILIPNPYFEDITSFASHCSLLEQSAREHPFEERDHRLFWRGHIEGNGEKYPAHCSRESGSFARLSAASLTSTRPDLFDVRCVTCDPRDSQSDPCPDFPFDPQMMWTVHHLNTIQGAYIEQRNFSMYQHFLNLPGSTSGSYSRNLNALWMLGGVVFLWQSDHVEWYYPALVNGVTHVTLNKSNAVDMLQMVKSDKALTERLILGARQIHETYICPECLASYFQNMLSTMRRKFMLGTVFDKHSYLSKFLRSHFDCTKLQLVEVIHSPNDHIYVNDVSKLSCPQLLDFARGHLHPTEKNGVPLVQYEQRLI